MYNVYICDKAQAQAEQVLKQAKAKHQNEVYKSKLLQRYQRTLLRRLADTPLNPLSRQAYSPAPTRPKKAFRYSYMNEKERIELSQKRNSALDTTPSPPPVSFRERSRLREIETDFRYSPKDRFERIKETWKKQNSIMDTSWKVSKDEINPFPSKLKRSYFKTIEELSVASSSALSGPSLSPCLVLIDSVEDLKRNLEPEDVMVSSEAMKPIVSDLHRLYGILKPN